MDIRRLRYFAAIAELGSFTRAAEIMNVAQPALSRHVQQLEAELGLELLIRTGRQVRATDAGQALLNHARTIERDFERLMEDMHARRGTPKGKVTYGIPPTLAEILVRPVTERIRTEYPFITLKVVEGLTPVLSDWLQTNRVDLALLSLGLIADESQLSMLNTEQIAFEEMVVFETAAPNRHAPAAYGLAELRRKPLILSRMFEEIVSGQLELADLGLNIELEIDSINAIRMMVIEGDAATLLPISVLTRELLAGRVTASSITSGGVRRALTLAHHRHRQMTRAFEAVLSVVREEVARLAGTGAFELESVRLPRPPRGTRRGACSTKA